MMVNHVGYIKFTIHTTTGFIGVGLMLVHALWSTLVILKNDENALEKFHRFSVFVWSIWFVSYLSGVGMGMKSVSGA